MRTVERVVPARFGSMDSVRRIGTDERRHYAFAAERGPFTAFAQGTMLHVRATITYTARGFYKPPIGPTLSAGCGRDSAARPRIVVELATPLAVTANWHLHSAARLLSVAPASSQPRDHCDVTILHRDVTEQVVQAARAALTGYLPAIDRRIGAVDLRPTFTRVWSTLARPIRLADGVWLELRPERLHMGRVKGRGHVLTVPVVLDARPGIVVADSAPAAVTTTVLPPLGRDTTAAGFHVIVDGTIGYGLMSDAVTAALQGVPFTKAGQTVHVDRVIVGVAAGRRLALDVTFTGDATGVLRLVGTPVLDQRRGEVTVPDLDFDLSTSSTLINGYSWLQSDELRAVFRERARFAAGPAMDQARALILKGLNRKVGTAVTLSASVGSVALQAIYLTRRAIVVRAEVSGQGAVAVATR